MQLIIFVSLAVAAAVAQDSTEPAYSQKCTPSNFIADSFEGLTFDLYKSYHDVENGIKYLTSNTRPGAWLLFDFSTGQVFINNGSYCVYNGNDDAKVTAQQVLDGAQEQFRSPSLGVPAAGFEYENGSMKFRGVLSTGCTELHLGIYENDVPRTLLYNSNIQTENVDLSPIQSAKDFIAADMCSKATGARDIIE